MNDCFGNDGRSGPSPSSSRPAGNSISRDFPAVFDLLLAAAVGGEEIERLNHTRDSFETGYRARYRLDANGKF